MSLTELSGGMDYIADVADCYAALQKLVLHFAW